MDYDKEFNDLQTCMKNFNINVASTLLSNEDFILYNAAKIIQLLGMELTEDNFRSRPYYFSFCEEVLLKMAQTEASRDCELIFEFLELIDMNCCKLSSSVLAVVTILENTESPNLVYLEYLLYSTFNHLNQMDDINLKDILLITINHLKKLNRHFQNNPSILYYFTRVAFLVLRANIDPIEYINILSNIIYDPFSLLEHDFEQNEDKLYLVSFLSLYFKAEILWGPKIYNRIYILEKCSDLALSVYTNKIGKSFAKLIFTKYKDNEIPLRLLNKLHEEFVVKASYNSMFNENLIDRKESLSILMIYINKLCSDAQYIFFKHTFSSCIDSCIKAELIIKLNHLIFSKIRLNQDLGYFQGIQLLELVRLCCNIPLKENFDILRNKEYVLSAMSLVYVLYAYNGNELKMGQEFSNETIKFVEAVQGAIDCTTQAIELESAKLVNMNTKEKIDLNIPKLSENEERDFIAQCTTTIKLMQSNLDLIKKIIKT